MEWTLEQEERFTELKLRELDELLSESEHEELTRLRSMVAEVEDETLVPALSKLQEENAKLQSLLIELNEENQELLSLSQNQSRLIDDTKMWISEFERRYAVIQNDFARLTHGLSMS